MRKSLFAYLPLFFLISLILSCGSSNSTTTKKSSEPSFIKSDLKSCDLKSRDIFLYSFLKDAYYWSDEVADVNISQYELLEDQKLLERFKAKEDRFSFIIDFNDYDNIFNSTTANDYGYLNMMTNEANTTLVYFVYPNSPADKAGIKRSDFLRVKSFGDDGKSATFEVYSNNGVRREVTLHTARYTKHEVLKSKIFDIANRKVGYFVLNSFVGKNINSDLDRLFKYFKNNRVNDLIVDLRYNTGGDISIAAHLASLIAGKKSFGHIFQHHIFNKKYSSLNNNSYFDNYTPYALNLDRVFVIVTDKSASASESLISALEASENDTQVIKIGQKTYGKPYSMYSIKYCNRVFFPILMKNLNSDYSEDYDNGFKPDCKVEDDYYHDFTDIDEGMLNNALFYLKNGVCKE